jgi:putative transferase (TIGR04331 family)
VSVIYDRYTHLKCALDQYSGCTTVVLSESAFVVPSDTLDFTCYLLEDSFNLQVYSKILASLGKTFPCKEVQIEQSAVYGKLAGRSWKHKVAGSLEKIYAGIGTKGFKSIFLRSSYFAKSVEARLLIKNAGKVLPILGHSTKPILSCYDSKIRKELAGIRMGDGEFEHCLSAMLFADVPKCFVEGFGYVSSEAQNAYPKFPKAIFSANAWYYEEAFKQWAAASAEKGTLLIGTPHGGSYGGLAIMPSENHETAIVDRYYSWGWERADCAAEVIPFPATKLVGRKKIGASNLKTGILWAGTSFPRYLLQFPALPKFFHGYLSWQYDFARTLSREIVANLRVRPHKVDCGWDIIQRLNECIPSVAIETWDVSFQESLVNCRLYVCDHCSTTFAEALAANKPTILFWNPQENELRPEAQPYYDLLRKNGILFDTPESAGVAVNQIYDDVETWWNDPERQNAVETFCERFARNSPDAIELWGAEFKRIAAMPGLNVNRVG